MTSECLMCEFCLRFLLSRAQLKSASKLLLVIMFTIILDSLENIRLRKVP